MGDPDAGPDLEAELESLYGLAPEGFVAARDDLVRRLRAAKRRDDAAAVKGLRRPTAAAWALNQLSRSRSDDLRRLIQEGDDVRRVQQEVLAGGDRDQLRLATTARRATRDALVDAALAFLAGDARTSPQAHRDDVVGTLEAASLEPDAGVALLQGRLATGLAPTTGFDLLAGSTVPTAERPEAGAAPAAHPGQASGGGHPATDTAAHHARLEEARQVAGDARALADQRRAEVGEAEQAAAAARRLAKDAAGEVERLAAELERARRSAAQAASAAEDAAARVADAERVAARAEAQAVTAEGAAARLADG